jgi:tetratricopeptide (TPR) repeat protein
MLTPELKLTMRKVEFDLEQKAAIKNELERVFGRCITSYRDCIQLSDDIFRKTQKQINPNTLRRIFGLVKAEYPPSQATLDILSKYCGFYSVEELCTSKQKVNNDDIVYQDQLLNFIVTLFIQTPVDDILDKTFLTLARHTITFLNNNDLMAEKFMNVISKTKTGQDLYFENFVNVDKLNSSYGNGLRYYLHAKGTEEASLFAHALITLKYWLNNNQEKILHQGDYLLDRNLSPASTEPYIMTRYFAALLFYAEAASMSADEILIDIYKYYSSAALNDNKEQLICFEYIISEALMLTGHSQDALYYLRNYRSTFNKSEYSVFFISLDNLKLLDALAHYKTGKYKTAERIFDEIITSDFHFLNKHFASILYLQLMDKLKRKNDKILETRTKLIQQTGFIRLNNFLDH